jgi:hypothetical protein
MSIPTVTCFSKLKHKGRGKGRKVGKSKENLLLLPDTHTCALGTGHTLVYIKRRQDVK